MSLWQSIKEGFGYSFGGTMGWHLGNWLAALIRRAWKLIAVGAFASGVGMWSSTPPVTPDKPKTGVVKKIEAPAGGQREIKTETHHR
jgi:hypothetical protein